MTSPRTARVRNSAGAPPGLNTEDTHTDGTIDRPKLGQVVFNDPAKLAHVRDELAALEKTWLAHPVAGHDIAELRARLKAVNERLWVIEDDVRLKEKAQAFDDDFVRLARSVYIENDERARIKKAINLALGSSYVEEKSYKDYAAR